MHHQVNSNINHQHLNTFRILMYGSSTALYDEKYSNMHFSGWGMVTIIQGV